jgi:hypothetical protein
MQIAAGSLARRRVRRSRTNAALPSSARIQSESA